MNKTLGKKSAQQNPIDDDSVMQEALRQWVEVCMLHIEYKKKLNQSTNESKGVTKCQKNKESINIR